ncbi:outer membrane protein assembly factor BamB family protein [Oerskovia turbata]
MPFRRREQTREIAFDAVDHLDGVDDHFEPERASARQAPPGGPGTPDVPVDRPSADPDATPGRGGAASGSGRRRRIALGGLAAALVLVLVGLTITDAVRARQADALLRVSPGGVVGLEKPPRELWSIESEQSQPVVVGSVVVLADDDGVAAHDPATGEESWRRADLPGHVCEGEPAQATGSSAGAAATLTCLGGAGPEGASPVGPPTTVVVLRLDGTTLVERELDPSRGTVQQLSDGALLRGARDARGAVVTIEDARTGEVRWRRDVPIAQGDGARNCQFQQEIETSADNPDVFYFHEVGHSIVLAGCGMIATFTRAGGDPEADVPYVRTLRDGRLLRTQVAGELTTEVLAPDGTTLWSVPGGVVEPLSTDGTAPALLFSSVGSGITAYDEDGQELWTFPRYTQQVLLTTRDLTVVATFPGAVALDNTTGEELWTWKAADAGSSNNAAAAFAGRGTLTLAIMTDPEQDARWTSIDLGDGSARWSERLPIDPSSAFAVDGRLFGAVDGRFAAFG